ncbi:DUF563 domain-containing protein [Nocardioides sp. cx-173]|uniref:glycosyltransferase family 61 protein n=1 Tax=Nocardioides sp. cx-173 TaxID=2898796 RepID=UPI001E395094|nr:glycosyltransferase 61 family protein [Nocardioides sp. cx-173]MCD4524612.1 glycosyltransferase family 61 protein [Nocardioides sp. cx-173]UGB42906.1 glycosyltransferase family 61 protein [Nocardioides sp. cx-173]
MSEPHRGRVVVMLVRGDETSVAERLARTEYAEGRVLTVAGVEAHERLRRLPRVDVVVDTRSDRPLVQWRSWRRLFFHLVHDGEWVVARREGDEVFSDRLAHLLLREGLRRQRAELARAVGAIRATPTRVVLTKAGDHWFKLRDAEAQEVLRERAPDLAVTELAHRPGGRLESRSTSHGFDEEGFAAPIEYPPLLLRRYDGALSLGEGVVPRHGRSLLPDAYRWHLQDVPVNKRLVDIDADWARPRPEDLREGPRLDGSFYYLDYKNPGHYGHLMTEAVSRLWGWDVAKQDDPDLRLLLRRGPKHPQAVEDRPESTILAAYGVAASDVTWVEGSVSVEHLVGLTPMWHNKSPYSAHPEIRAVWERIADGLAAAEPTAVAGLPARRIFVTRHEGKRRCRNVAEVDAFFEAHGFTLVRPGTMSLAQQAATFAAAEVVAGFGGTGMFNLCYARRLQHLVVLNHTSYDARNEQLFAAVHGARSDFFWSEPDIPHPESGWSYEAFQSPWAFDLDRNRAALQAVLDSPA